MKRPISGVSNRNGSDVAIHGRKGRYAPMGRCLLLSYAELARVNETIIVGIELAWLNLEIMT